MLFRSSTLGLLAICLGFSVSAHSEAPPVQFDSITFAKNFIGSLNQLLGTNLRLTLETGNTADKTIPHGGEGEVSINRKDLENYSRMPYGEKTPEALAFILAHEASHNLIDNASSVQAIPYSDSDVSYLNEHLPEFKQLSLLIGDLEHENVDAFAAKLLRELNYPIAGGVVALKDCSHRYAYHPRSQQVNNVLRERGRLIQVAYAEGWDSWNGYNQMISPCAVDAQNALDFLKSKGADKILSQIGTRRCTYFANEIFLGTLLRGIDRFKSIYLD